MKRDLRFYSFLLPVLAGLALLISSPLGIQAQWSQLGTDIEGLNANDQLGHAMDVNGDGTSIVVGAHFNDGSDGLSSNIGHVRVFDWDGAAWVQRGSAIYGSEDGDQAAWSLSIDTAGNRIAIGAIYNDGPDDLSANMGQVRVYDWSGSAWTMTGSAIYGAAAGDECGEEVALSADGNLLAIGSSRAGTAESGHVRVFEWSGTAWDQVGSIIEGVEDGDRAGYAVDLSADGSALAVGAHLHESDALVSVGHVRVFGWSGTDWTLRGTEIEGVDEGGNAGKSVSLNEDGSILAIGAPGYDISLLDADAGKVMVYEWTGSAWSQLGADIIGAANNSLGTDVSLDSEGNSLAVGAIANPTLPGHLQFHAWDGAAWLQEGAVVPGDENNDGFGRSARISADGRTVIAGARNFDGASVLSGVARAFRTCNNTGIDIIEACDMYEWIDGIVYSEDNNTAQWTVTNAAGCDSVVTLDLTILESNMGTDVQVACETFTWIDGLTYTESNNTATWTLTNVAGCDSVVTLDLTILEANAGTDVQEACETYTWIDGITYTTSTNTPTWVLTNVAGCDSIVTLDLTILEATAGTDVQEACETYTWIDGLTYTESTTTPTWVLTNADGCDSVVTLNLTILEPSTGTDVQEACETYTWIDGITYTASTTTPTWVLTNADGCDSIVTLNLTILEATAGTDVQTACDSYTWIDGVKYTSSNNTATWVLTNADGCDSIVTLDLTVNYTTRSNLTVDVNGNYSSPSGKVLTETGTYYDTIPNAAGCDSVITIYLTNHVGIEDMEGDLAMKYYPNPVDNELRLEFENPFTGTIKVHDMNGRMLAVEQRKDCTLTTIQTSELRSGIYILRLDGEEQNYLFRITKQ